MYGRFAMGCWLRRQVEKQYRLRTDRFPVIPPCIWLGVFLGSSGQLSRCTTPPAMAKYSSGWFPLHNQHVGFARTFAPRTFESDKGFAPLLKSDSRLPKGRWSWIGWYCAMIRGSGLPRLFRERSEIQGAQAPTTDVLSRRFSGLLVLERHGATFPRVTGTGTRSFSAFVDGPRAACSRRSSTPYRLMPTSST